MTQRLLTAILIASICAAAHANTANFNTLSAGTSYAPSSLFSNGGLDFDVLFGLNNVNVAAASGLVNPSFTGNYLNLKSNTGLNVNLPTGSSQIQFDFIQNNSAALVINGGWLDSSQIPGTINGVTVVHLLGSKTSPWGSITASGNINSFVIVGTELLVDNINATLLAGLSGDYNKNHIVDAGDYDLWRKNLNSRSGYNSWRSNFGATGGSGTSLANAAVPEPSTLTTMYLSLFWFISKFRRSHSGRDQRRAV
jgi:hypothetical protein